MSHDKASHIGWSIATAEGRIRHTASMSYRNSPKKLGVDVALSRGLTPSSRHATPGSRSQYSFVGFYGDVL